MSKTIERNVVEMQFDNSNFEKNVQQSMSTIDKLKAKLSFDNSDKALKGLERAANNIDLSGLSGTIEAISSKFSTMGIVGMTTISRITNELLSSLGRIASSIKDLTVTGGLNRAMNIEKAKFQLQGLGIEWEKVSDAIDYAVTNTAYSLDAAAQAASQLSAAGLDYENVIFVHESDKKELTEMSMALRAVSGVAAQTQSDYAMVARYFQDVANAGKVTGSTLTYMTQVLNLPVEQNLAEGLKAIADGSYEASDAVRESAKKIVASVDLSSEGIKKACKDGLIDFDTFSTIMFNKYADHAVDANKTLEGVTANIRSAFARIGAEFMQPIIANEGPLVSMLEKVRVKVNDIKKAITPLAQKSAKYVSEAIDGIAKFIDKIDVSSGLASTFEKGEYAVEHFADVFKSIIPELTKVAKSIKDIYKAIFPKKTVDQFKKSFDTFIKKLKKFKVSASSLGKIKSIFSGIFSTISLGIKAAKNLMTVLKPVGNVIGQMASKLLDYAARLGDFITRVNLGTKAFSGISDAADKFKEVFHDIKWVVNSVVGLFNNEFAGCQTLVEKVGQSIIDIFTGALYAVTHLISAITGIDVSSVEGKIERFWENLTTMFHTFYDKVQQNGGGIEGLIETIWDALKSLGKKFTDWVKETTGIDLTKLRETIEECVERVKESFGDFIESFKPLEKARQIVEDLTTAIENLVETVKGVSASALMGVGKILENPFLTLEAFAKSDLITSISNFIKRVNNQGLGQTIAGIAGPLETLRGTLMNFTNSVKAQKLLSMAGAIIGFAVAIGILAAGVAKIGAIEGYDKILVSVGGVLALMIGLIASFVTAVNFTSGAVGTATTKWGKLVEALKNTVIKSTIKMIAAAAAMVIIAKAVKILADTVASMAKLDFGENSEKVLDGLIIVIGSMALLVLAFMGLNEIINGLHITTKSIMKIMLVAATFGILADAIGTMTESMVSLNKMNQLDPYSTLASFGEVIIMFFALVAGIGELKVPNTKGIIKTALAMAIIASSIGYLVDAIVELNKEDPIKTLESFGLVLILLYATITEAFMISGRTIPLKTAVGLIALALSIAILCKQIKQLAEMPIDEIAKGFIVLYGILGTFTVIATAFKEEMAGLIQAGVAMFAFALALKVVASAIAQLSSYDLKTVAENLAVLIVAMYTMSALMQEMASNMNAGSFLEGAGGLLAIAAALWVVSDALAKMAGLRWEDTITNALILIGIIATLSLIATKLTVGLAGGVALLAISVGIAAVAAALSLLAGTKGWAFAAAGAIILLIAVLGGLAMAANALSAPLLIGAAVIAGFMTIIAVGVAAINWSLGSLAVSIGLIASSTAGAAEGLKILGDTVVELGKAFKANDAAVKEFTVILFKMVTISFTLGAGLAVLGVGAAAAAIGVAALAVGGLALAAALAALGAALDYVLPKINTELKSGLESTEPLMEKAGEGITNSIAKGIVGNTPAVKKAAKQVAADTKNSFNSELGISSPSKVFMESGKYIDLGLAEGMTKNSNLVESASKALGEKSMTSLNNSIVKGTNEGSTTLANAVKQYATITEKGSEAAGVNTGVGFLKGLSSQKGNIMKYAANLAKAAMASMRSYLKIKSPSRVAMEIGEYTGEGFALGMGKTEGMVDNSAQDLGKTAEKSLTTALSKAYENLTSDVSDPTIKPVLDLSEIQNGVSSIDSMLSREYASNISANYRSERAYQAEQNAANNQLLSNLNGQLLNAIASNDMSNLPININVQLVGDAEGLFKAVVAENNRWSNMTGSSLLLQG